MRPSPLHHLPAAVFLALALLVLGVLTVRDWRAEERGPVLLRRAAESPSTDKLEARLTALPGLAAISAALPATNLPSPFHTTYFQPVAPPPPTTRKVQVTFRGYYQVAAGLPHAFYEVDGKPFAKAVGAQLVGDWWVQSAGSTALSLTNAAGLTNRIELNKSQTFEIPLR